MGLGLFFSVFFPALVNHVFFFLSPPHTFKLDRSELPPCLKLLYNVLCYVPMSAVDAAFCET